MTIQAREFRNALGRFATGVTVVTMQDGERVHGITVNAFMSVSLEPPLVLIAIDNQSRSLGILTKSERYGISVLAEHQAEHSDAFARRARPGFQPTYGLLGGFPVLEGACAQLVCRITDVRQAGDHTLFIAEVEQLAYGDAKPLLFHGGRYTALREMELQPA